MIHIVYITGDTHGSFERLNEEYFPDQKEMTRDDTLIICGDFGGVWRDCVEERIDLNMLENKPFTTVFVDGNHENFDSLENGKFDTVDFHGGKAHRIRPHIYHLMRGHIFDFEGKSFFCFGGAKSHDIRDGIIDRDDYNSDDAFFDAIQRGYWDGKIFRINHVSWWERELPTEAEMKLGFENLNKHNNQVDYVVTHCCPQQVAAAMGFHNGDYLTAYFDEIASKVKFDRWYFGHYHDDKNIFGKFTLLYTTIERVI